MDILASYQAMQTNISMYNTLNEVHVKVPEKTL